MFQMKKEMSQAPFCINTCVEITAKLETSHWRDIKILLAFYHGDI